MTAGTQRSWTDFIVFRLRPYASFVIELHSSHKSFGWHWWWTGKLAPWHRPTKSYDVYHRHTRTHTEQRALFIFRCHSCLSLAMLTHWTSWAGRNQVMCIFDWLIHKIMRCGIAVSWFLIWEIWCDVRKNTHLILELDENRNKKWSKLYAKWRITGLFTKHTYNPHTRG